MRSLPKPAHLEIRIDEWQVAQKNIDAVDVEIRWRGARDDSALAELLAALPRRNEFVPIRLVDGRTELAFKSWQRTRFGKGPPIFEAARSNYEAWAGGATDPLPTARKYLTEMIQRHVPNFDDHTDKNQVDFIIRTQEEINAVHDSVEALIAHLEYATPGGRSAHLLLKNPLDNIQAAVFSDVMGSRDAGDLLKVPQPPSDKRRYENQTVLKRAKAGRELLCGYFGEAEWKTKVQRLREYRRWWAWYESLDNKDGIYALLAKAQNTSLQHEKLSAESDGFDRKLERWIAVVEERLKAQEMSWEHRYSAQGDEAESTARRLWADQVRIEETDERFDKALSVFDAPPSGKP